jgi:hypothetical protein
MNDTKISYGIKKSADFPGWLSGGLVRFCCHWQRTPYMMKGIIFLSRQNQTVMSLGYIGISHDQ